MSRAEPATSRLETRPIHYNSSLSISHFSCPEFERDCKLIFRHLAAAYDHWPQGRESAKVWETVQGWRALRDLGVLGDQAEVLGVGAGSEALVFWLTKYARRVFATDLYTTNTDWVEAAAGMLENPAAFCPPGMPFDAQRLVVQHMNALDLKHPADSFDAIFSCGSIEHFGSLENVAQAAREMGRVLKPGGVLVLATEFRLSGPDGIGVPGEILFTPEMLFDYIVEPSGLEPVDEPDLPSDAAPYAYPLAEAVQNGIRNRSICLEHDGYVWTSVSLCLRKPD